jgi:hypothetical protein
MKCNELSRFSETYASLMAMDKPEGTRFIQGRNASLARSLNILAEDFLSHDEEYMFLVDDDQLFPPDTLTRLLAHKKDIVGGIYLRRGFPFEPVVFDHASDSGRVRPHFLNKGETGLVPVKALGMGCLLLHRRVLETMKKPWWALATIEPDLISEDLTFCRDARNAGFEIWCDLDVKVGHIAIIPIWPHFQDGEWSTLLATGGRTRVQLETASAMFSTQLAAEDHR